MIGKQILHYRILEKLGEGGMGIVYLAEDTKLDRKVAIKFLPGHITGNSDERKRFEVEAKAAAALNHPNIATIYAIEHSDDEVFIVMEYIDGQELKEKLKAGPLPVAECVEIAEQIALGLEAAHEKHIIHRDIKSTNIMITSKGRVKIMDFGLAKVRGGVELTKEQSTIGTAAYMSPEQARGDAQDHRSDIWSFGVVLYEMLCGKIPFKGDYNQAVIYSILNETPNFDADLPADIPLKLRRIVSRTLQREPKDRYQQMADVLTDLTQFSPQTKSISQTTSNSESSSNQRRKITPVLYISGVLLIMVIALYFIFVPTDTDWAFDSETERKMIVVLPFENLGPAEDEYFADGLAEEITSRLSSFPELGVIARTSALQYKNTNKGIDQIGAELNVDYVVEGTVRWDRGTDGPSRIRVTPQLIRVSDATNLWSDRYDKVIDDIFSVQSDIAEKVIAQLDINLLESTRKALRTIPTKNIEAYTIFLKGKEKAQYYDERRIRQSIELLEQAISLDPEFAKAYSYLSQSHSSMVHFGHDRSESRREIAKQYAEVSLALAPEDPDSHIAMAYYHYWVNRDYNLAEREFAIAERFQPNNADILAGRSFVQRRQGRWHECIVNLQSALALNPLSYTWFADHGYTHTMLRRYEEALQYFNKSIQVGTDFSFAHATKCNTILLWKGDLETARSIIRDLKANDDWSYFVWLNQYIYEKKYQDALDLLTKMGIDQINMVSMTRPKSFLTAWVHRLNNQPEQARREFITAQKMMEDKIRENSEDFRHYSTLGIIYAILGEREKAVQLGQKAVGLYSDSVDALDGSWVILDLAWIYTLTADYESALQKLDYILSIPSAFSTHLMNLDPKWEPLRNHRGYQTLLEKYSVD